VVMPDSAPRLAIFDLDGTLTRRDSFGPFVLGLLARHPARWLRLPLLLVPLFSYLLRQLDRGALKGAVLHTLFAGLHRQEVQHWAEQYAAHVVPRQMFAEAVSAFRAHLAAGDHVVVLSASPDIYVPSIAKQLGATEVICTAIRWQLDRLDGRLAGPNRRDLEKVRVLTELRRKFPGRQVIAYGNSGADLPHLLQCEAAVFVNANAGLAARLAAKGLRCVHWQ
jgi:phosphatidylglycerophosphatase C